MRIGGTKRLLPLLCVGMMLVFFQGFASGGEKGKEASRPTLEMNMVVENWRWIPNVLRVKQGSRVILHIRSRNATHAFLLKDYRLKVMLPQDKTTTVEFTADKAGTFRWRCGRPCGKGCAKMLGTLTVLEAEPGEEPSKDSSSRPSQGGGGGSNPRSDAPSVGGPA